MQVARAIAAIDSLLALNATAVNMFHAQNLSASRNTHNSSSSVSFASAMRSHAKGGPDLNNANCP